ncbi:pilus assembly protein TadG-related protein [Streptomyces lichenis]|uniref:Pilus assembly protein TadG-related protein n=1 Tax=Streptomyces lichenis TaxID=2306967 RepID=A0ABT0IF08_9ACTN|nr:pilus assembly protein TadG-related protein [Streptomyces lichenis]
MGSLLFLALALFAVGQAGATRNNAQSAADAAALAAARESRDSVVLTEDMLVDLLDGVLVPPGTGCGEASAFAQQNGAGVTGCGAATDGRWGSQVSVRSLDPVGQTILPGTETRHATATATAVVVPRCTAGDASEEDSEVPDSLDCDGETVEVVPLPSMSDLFDIRLAEN